MPGDPTPEQAREWVNLYTELVDLLRRTGDETKQFRDRCPPLFRSTLNVENVKILDEELEDFQARLAYWKDLEANASDH